MLLPSLVLLGSLCFASAGSHVFLDAGEFPGGFAATEAATPREQKTGPDTSRDQDFEAPVPNSMPDAEYTEEARAAKIEGSVLVILTVGLDGLPRRVKVTRGLGYGLDEKALEAVSRLTFKPATHHGKPVAVEVSMEISFRLKK